MGKYFTLTFYEKNLQPGEMWIRTPDDKVLPAHEALKNVFIKYKNVDPNVTGEPGYSSFYDTLNTGRDYLRFDIIQDVIFVENSKGCIFDQIVYENGTIQPKTQDNNFLTSLSFKRFGFPSYYFDEHEQKIYIASNSLEDWAGSQTWEEDFSGLTLKYVIEEFDMVNSILDVKCHFNLNIKYKIPDFYKDLPIVEPALLSYNNDTKTFNLSNISRGPKKQFGLISIDILKERNELNVKRVNAFLPLQDIKVPFIIPEEEPTVIVKSEIIPSNSSESLLIPQLTPETKLVQKPQPDPVPTPQPVETKPAPTTTPAPVTTVKPTPVEETPTPAPKPVVSNPPTSDPNTKPSTTITVDVKPTKPSKTNYEFINKSF